MLARTSRALPNHSIQNADVSHSMKDVSHSIDRSRGAFSTQSKFETAIPDRQDIANKEGLVNTELVSMDALSITHNTVNNVSP